ncbi:hypothetical protein BDF20DRAFT_790674, partial [Mycotypha africana]|uniref:uncharacterized protein n=1 Tax=Mycotypha africana TaxID=64632 RepID=UPI0023017D06
KSSVQPKPTKASLLRLQAKQQHELPSSLAPAMTKTTSSQMRKGLQSQQSSSTSTTSPYTSAGPSAGLKAFMAKQRARMANDKSKASEINTEDNHWQPISAKNYSNQDSSRPAVEADSLHSQRKLAVIIKQAKASGRLDIASRSLTRIPKEVIEM